MLVIREHVALTPAREKDFRRASIVAQKPTEPRDEDVDRTGLSFGRVAPHFDEQFFSGNEGAAFTPQVQKQGHLAFGKRVLLTVATNG